MTTEWNMEEVIWSNSKSPTPVVYNKDFDIVQLKQKNDPKPEETVIVKICKKKEAVDDVFSDKLIEPGSLIVDKTDVKFDRNYVLNRLRKMMNGDSIEEFKSSSLFLEESKEDEKETKEDKKEEEEEESKEEEEEKKEKKEKEVVKKIRTTKKQLPIPENMIEFTNKLYNEMTKQKKHAIHKASGYYMTNRGLFIRELNKLFEPHAAELAKVNDADVSCDKRSTEDFEILTHQRVVRDYLNLYSPYRGLIIYHGLGSGKTCTSIAVAEGMKSEKQIIVMTPASLKSNFFSELKKCGDDIYRKNQKWIKVQVTQKKDASQIKKIIGLDEEYILENGVWLGKKTGDGNKFEDLTPAEQIEVDKQLDLMIRKKYNDINYNGLNGRKLNEITDNGKINPFDNKVVIIDEVHNFVSRIVNKVKKPDSLSYRLYDYLMSAQNVKIVFLTGTPIINYPNEIAILFNMLRGYIKTWTFLVQQTTSEKVDRDKILEFFKKGGFIFLRLLLSLRHDPLHYQPLV
jgi:flagellar biosynthesis GTPase FlhF